MAVTWMCPLGGNLSLWIIFRNENVFHFVKVLVSWDCCNESWLTSWLKVTQVSSLSIPEDRCSESRFGRPILPLKGLWRIFAYFSFSSSFWGSLHSWVCRHIPLISKLSSKDLLCCLNSPSPSSSSLKDT